MYREQHRGHDWIDASIFCAPMSHDSRYCSTAVKRVRVELYCSSGRNPPCARRHDSCARCRAQKKTARSCVQAPPNGVYHRSTRTQHATQNSDETPVAGLAATSTRVCLGYSCTRSTRVPLPTPLACGCRTTHISHVSKRYHSLHFSPSHAIPSASKYGRQWYQHGHLCAIAAPSPASTSRASGPSN